jgi:hypothetical protein
MNSFEFKIHQRIFSKKGIFKNSRLETLSDKAKAYADSAINGDFYNDWHEAFEMKFSELLVQDCLDHIDYAVDEDDAFNVKHNIKLFLGKWDYT